MDMEKPLSHMRLLIVEDEYLVAMELADALEDLGADIAGVTGRLSEALEAADAVIDGALVDVQLGGDTSTALVEKLKAAGIPLILMTGYDSSVLPESMHQCPRIPKPFAPEQLERMTRKVFVLH